MQRWTEVETIRLIDADALWERLNYEPWENNADRDAIALPIVNAAPTVDAEVVVRCKDCKHEFGGSCIVCGFQKRKPDDFCSYGERKEE